MAKRNQDPPKAENHERWLLTYADLITLLMIFFVVMYTISNINSKKFAQLSQSMSQALIGQNSGYFIGSAPGPLVIQESDKVAGGREMANMTKAKEQIEKYIENQGLKGKVEVSQEERGLVISMKEALLFDLGSADITPEAQKVILSVGKILATLDNSIRIEGHTDNLPIHTARFPSNWELSTTRATNVLDFLVNHAGIAPEKLSATGYGEYRPIVPNTTEANRARNRRVDIVVLRNALDIAEPGNAGQAAQDLQTSQTNQEKLKQLQEGPVTVDQTQ